MASLAKVLLFGVPVFVAALVESNKRKQQGFQPLANSIHPVTPPMSTQPVSMSAVPTGGVIDSLSEDFSQAREQQILDAIRAGAYEEITWATVRSVGEGELVGYTLDIPVMADALKIEGVRVIGTLRSGQAIADMLGAMMMTPYVAGLISEQADARIAPNAPQPASAKKSRMLQESATTDRALANYPGFVLTDNAGKFWTISIRNTETAPHPVSGQPKGTAAVNHGLFPSPWMPIQNRGTFHSIDNHADSTQNHRFIGLQSQLTEPDGRARMVATKQIVMDTKFGPLLNGVRNKFYGKQLGEGVLPYDRHPAIPEPGTLIA